MSRIIAAAILGASIIAATILGARTYQDRWEGLAPSDASVWGVTLFNRRTGAVVACDPPSKQREENALHRPILIGECALVSGPRNSDGMPDYMTK